MNVSLPGLRRGARVPPTDRTSRISPSSVKSKASTPPVATSPVCTFHSIRPCAPFTARATSLKHQIRTQRVVAVQEPCENSPPRARHRPGSTRRCLSSRSQSGNPHCRSGGRSHCPCSTSPATPRAPHPQQPRPHPPCRWFVHDISLGHCRDNGMWVFLGRECETQRGRVRSRNQDETSSASRPSVSVS